MKLQEVRDQIVKLGVDMRAILDGVSADNRLTLNPDEKTKFDTMDTDRKALIETETRVAGQEEIEQRYAGGTGRKTEAGQPRQETRQEEQRSKATAHDQIEGLRSWLLAASDVPLKQEQRTLAQRIGLNLDARRLMLRLPDVALRSKHRDDVRSWEDRAQSTLSSSSPVDGYYTIANEMMRPLEEALLAFGGMRQAGTVIRTTTGAELPIPTANDTSNTGEIITENTAVNQQDVAFNQLVLNSFLYSSKMILVSVQLLQDSSINIAEYIGRALGTRIGRITNTHFTTGDASSKPNGLLNATTASGTQLAAQTPTHAELVAVQHSVDPAYRGNGRWMFHDSMLAEIKKMVDASTGRPLWMPSLIAGEPDTILGDGYIVNQAVAVAAGSGAGKSIAYGDLSKYIIRDVRDITLMRLDERFAEYHQVAFLAFSRHDGDLLDAGTNPVKHALNKA
jgi:HK97 family phage major capsid protein